MSQFETCELQNQQKHINQEKKTIDQNKQQITITSTMIATMATTGTIIILAFI